MAQNATTNLRNITNTERILICFTSWSIRGLRCTQGARSFVVMQMANIKVPILIQQFKTWDIFTGKGNPQSKYCMIIS